MSGKKSRATDPDFAGTEAALRRSARRAREVARQKGTPIAVWRDGRVVREYVDADAVAEGDGEDGPGNAASEGGARRAPS